MKLLVASILILGSVSLVPVRTFAASSNAECAKKGGRWVRTPYRAEKFGCILPDPNFGKECSDQADCGKGPCVVVEARQGDAVWEHPKGNCSDKFQLVGRCYIGRTPYSGCHWFLKRGKCDNLCVEAPFIPAPAK